MDSMVEGPGKVLYVNEEEHNYRVASIRSMLIKYSCAQSKLLKGFYISINNVPSRSSDLTQRL